MAQLFLVVGPFWITRFCPLVLIRTKNFASFKPGACPGGGRHGHSSVVDSEVALVVHPLGALVLHCNRWPRLRVALQVCVPSEAGQGMRMRPLSAGMAPQGPCAAEAMGLSFLLRPAGQPKHPTTKTELCLVELVGHCFSWRPGRSPRFYNGPRRAVKHLFAFSKRD